MEVRARSMIESLNIDTHKRTIYFAVECVPVGGIKIKETEEAGVLGLKMQCVS